MLLKNSYIRTIKSIGIGLIVGTIVTLLGALVTSVMISAEKIGEDKAIYGIGVSLILGSFMSAGCSALKADGKKVLVCMISGALYLFSLFCLTACFFSGRYENVWGTILLVMGSSIASALIATRGRKSRAKIPKRRVRVR